MGEKKREVPTRRREYREGRKEEGEKREALHNGR